ncbi:MAG: hypothetical protein KDK39_01115 [Leptospiraceae bacterium]|nr:hypothetical protein [Leptospiraceae bacterium]
MARLQKLFMVFSGVRILRPFRRPDSFRDVLSRARHRRDGTSAILASVPVRAFLLFAGAPFVVIIY